jgi:hypothetical protein
MTQEPLTKLNPHSVVVHHSIILLSIMEIIPLFMDLTKYISSLKLLIAFIILFNLIYF